MCELLLPDAARRGGYGFEWANVVTAPPRGRRGVVAGGGAQTRGGREEGGAGEASAPRLTRPATARRR